MGEQKKQPDATGAVILLIIIILLGAAGVVWFLADTGEADWDVRDLRVVDAGWWIAVEGTLINVGDEDAEFVTIHVWVSVNGLKYYEDWYLGDIPAGGAKDFSVLVSCDFDFDYDTIRGGVDKVEWW